MNEITIRNLDDNLLRRLKQWAWRQGLPLEESLRLLLIETTGKSDHGQTRQPCDMRG
jgi:plasmid stability protein